MSSLRGGLVLASVVILAAWPGFGGEPKSEPKPAPKSPKKVRLDQYGDPLPPGAIMRLGSTRLRHAWSVTSLAFLPDGKRLLSGGWDKTARLWEVTTGKLIPEVWERWLAHDPVRMVPQHAQAMRAMKAIYIDAGKRDEFFLDLGAEAFRRALAGIGITSVFFELFDATHMSIEYRYPLSLKYLAERLST